MVFVALNSLINSVNSGLHYILGQSYARNDGSYEKTHDTYDSFYMAMVFSLISVAYILICPFVKLYTAGVTDAEYIDYYLPVLFVMIQLLSCGRATSARLITISGHAKATQFRSLIEAGINLTVSILLANLIGIYGVLIGTVVALLFRANDIIIYANKKILKRNPIKTYSKVLINFGAFGFIALFEFLVRKPLAEFCNSYVRFCLLGVIITIISVAIYFSLAIVLNPDVKKMIRRKLLKK